MAKCGKMDSLLEKAIADELKEIVKKTNGEFIHDVTTRMRVYDRALKLQSIKLKADDPEWGAAFEKGEKSE